MLRFFAVLAFLSTPLVAVAQAPKGPSCLPE